MEYMFIFWNFMINITSFVFIKLYLYNISFKAKSKRLKLKCKQDKKQINVCIFFLNMLVCWPRHLDRPATKFEWMCPTSEWVALERCGVVWNSIDPPFIAETPSRGYQRLYTPQTTHSPRLCSVKDIQH